MTANSYLPTTVADYLLFPNFLLRLPSGFLCACTSFLHFLLFGAVLDGALIFLSLFGICLIKSIMSGIFFECSSSFSDDFL